MKKRWIILLTVILNYVSNGDLFAQKDLTNYKGRISMLAEIGGPEVLGAHLNVYLSNRISVNGGLGINLDAHIGSNLNFNRTEYSSLIVGVQVCSYRKFTFSGNSGIRQLGIYIPIGFEYYAEKGFTLQIDFGPNFVKEDWGQTNTSPFLISVKIGIQVPRY